MSIFSAKQARDFGLFLFATALTALLFSASPALAARGHEFSKTFGEPCLAEPCIGKELKNPDGVAVNEATGDVYVTDTGTTPNRVVVFSKDGVFQSELAGPNAIGTGTLTSGSATVESAFAASGAFSVGEEITALGLPAGTTITAVTPATLEHPASLELSQAATASEEPASLAAKQNFQNLVGVAVDNYCALKKLANSEFSAEEQAEC